MAPSRARSLVLLLLAAGCAPGTRPPPPVAARPPDSAPASPPVQEPRPAPALPPVPEVRGRLALRVVYPPSDASVRARDSTFLFGSVGTGEARLTVDGRPVQVWPNGAWIAWVPLAGDSLLRFRLDAWTETDSVSGTHVVRRADWRRPPPATLWIDTTAMWPRGTVWWPRDEYLTLRARASEGATLRLRLPGGGIVPLEPAPEPAVVDPAVRAFDRDTANLLAGTTRDRYAGVIRGRALGPDPGPVLVPPSVMPPLPPPAVATTPIRCAGTDGCPRGAAPRDSLWAVLEAIRGPDTVRSRWFLQLALLDTLPLIAELDDDTAGLGDTDRLTVGRALPGGTYHWFFPTGTQVPVTGRVGDDLRLRLAPGIEAWVPQAEAKPAPAGAGERVVVGSLTLSPAEDRVALRVPLTRRVPFQVVEDHRTLRLQLYGAVGDVNWIRYAPGDSLVRLVRWAQDGPGQVTLVVELERPVWGYRARWDRNDLLFEVRRPPALDGGRPLRGRLIAVDPGHPPAGATGPTGLREAEANLAIALEVQRMLEEAGARVLMTRTADVPLDLWPRVRMAEEAGADVLVSIHNNALPDGINPFTNSGTSVYYNHPRSIGLARSIQDELVRHTRLRDLGVGRGDLALVRATWMPSVLTEGMFMILPEQEAALRSVEGRRLYARAVVEGLRRFLRDRARDE